jgi:hypothetical protein
MNVSQASFSIFSSLETLNISYNIAEEEPSLLSSSFVTSKFSCIIHNGIHQCSEGLRNLYHSPKIIIMTKSRRLRLAGHIARWREKRNTFSILVGKPEEKRPLGRQDVGGWMI